MERPVIRFPRTALDRSICDTFEQQVARHGNRTAVKSQSGELTYAALNRAANRVAHGILARSRPRPEPVAMLLEQGVSEIVALLGVLKAGHPYVALTPSYPPARLARLLEDSTATLLVTSAGTLARLQEPLPDQYEVLTLDELDTERPEENPAIRLAPDSLASITYTSGSTGEPKGVLHTHRTLVHRVLDFVDSSAIEPEDRIALLLPCSFSASVRLLFGALLTGASLHPFDPAANGPEALAAWVGREGITVYSSVPAVFRRLADALSATDAFPALRLIRLIGDTLTTADVERYRQHFPPRCALVNALSANEVGTIAEYVVDHARPLGGDIVPAGYAAQDKEIFLIDDIGAGVRPGDVGEIAVRSRYLSPGYWRRPDLTHAAFLPDPQDADARIYRTGDLGRLRPDGCLEPLGRKDLRVKIRGQRVEVTEIEMALRDLGVREAVVVGREDGAGEPRLVAYVVPRGRPAPTIGMLRRGLSERLPAHMVPAAFVLLDALPLTPNGKVDRQALPSPGRARPELESPFVAPRTPVEDALAEIWAEALGLDRVGVHDHFLDLGGHSLVAMQVVSRVIQRFTVDIPVRALFEAPSVAAMAVVLVGHLAMQAGDEEMSRLWADVGGALNARNAT